jgi:hypothetical protein
MAPAARLAKLREADRFVQDVIWGSHSARLSATLVMWGVHRFLQRKANTDR